MPTLVIPGAFQVSIHAEISGQEIVNTIGLIDQDFGSAFGAATVVKNAWEATGGPLDYLPAGYKLQRFKGVNLSTADGEITEVASSAVGKGATAVGPLSTCAVVRIGAGTRSRSGKGRLYYGPIQQAALNPDGRTITTAIQAGILSRFQAFQTAINTNGYNWAVLSRKLSAATVVENISVGNVIGTQRRRLR